jgi:DNA polymerase III epsilon subunit-like protein
MIIFMDTETTSLLAIEAADLAHQPHIIEIACVKTDYDFNITDIYTTLIKPPIRIPLEVINIHGITDEEVSGQKPFAGYYRQLSSFFIGVTHLIGHNLQFDKRMLENELKRINRVTNFPWPPKNICTVEEIMKIKGHRMSLSDLHFELFGQGFEEAHRAESDTMALVSVYKTMIYRKMVEFKQ